MTPAERFLATLRGEAFSGPVSLNDAHLVTVDAPLTRALRQSPPLTQTLQDDPDSGHAELAELIAETRQAILSAQESGADAILYRLHGASPEFCSPMEFGGFFLEEDRALLAECTVPAILWLEGGTDLYLESVTDLPAAALGWPDPQPAEIALVRTAWSKPLLISNELVLADFHAPTAVPQTVPL